MTHYQIVSGIKVVTRKGFTPKVKQMDIRLDDGCCWILRRHNMVRNGDWTATDLTREAVEAELMRRGYTIS